jgi:hypothetical protein
VNRQSFRFAFSVLVLAITIFSFQNCGAGFESSHLSEADLSSKFDSDGNDVQSVSVAGLPIRTLSSFGAKGDGVTDDTAALRKAFEAVGVLLDGESNLSKSYRVNGTLNTKHALYLQNATLIQVGIGYTTRTILVQGDPALPAKVYLKNLVLDLRGDETMGSSSDSAGIWLSYTEPSLQKVEVKGTLGKGFGILIAGSKNLSLIDLYVHDLTWRPFKQDRPLNWSEQSKNWGAGTSQNILYFKGFDANRNPIFESGRLNEQLTGIMIANSRGVSIVRPKVQRLRARFDDNSVYPYQTDGLDVASGTVDVKIDGAMIDNTWEGIDAAGVPATNVFIQNSTITDVHAYAFKFANAVDGFTVLNSTAARCGMACYVVSGLSSAGTFPGTRNGWLINVKSTDAGVGPGGRNLWGGLATTASVRIFDSAFSNPSRIRVVNSSLQSAYTPNAVHAEPSGVTHISDVTSSQQNFQVRVASTSWSAIASMFTSAAGRAPKLDEQKYWFTRGTDSGLTTAQIQSEMKTALGTSTPTPTPTPVSSGGSCLFAGRQIPNGVAVVAYQQGGLPAGYSCMNSGFYQLRLCTNGVLSGTYLNASCTVSGATGASCSFDGRSILHGNATVAYQQGNLPTGYNCNSLPYYQLRTCSNGSLSGTYTQASCRAQ